MEDWGRIAQPKGAIAAQLFEFEQESDASRTSRQAAGTVCLEMRKGRTPGLALPTLTPEEFSATVRQPSVALATDGELHNQIGNTIEALFLDKTGGGSLPNVDLFWRPGRSSPAAGAEIAQAQVLIKDTPNSS